MERSTTIQEEQRQRRREEARETLELVKEQNRHVERLEELRNNSIVEEQNRHVERMEELRQSSIVELGKVKPELLVQIHKNAIAANASDDRDCDGTATRNDCDSVCNSDDDDSYGSTNGLSDAIRSRKYRDAFRRDWPLAFTTDAYAMSCEMGIWYSQIKEVVEEGNARSDYRRSYEMFFRVTLPGKFSLVITRYDYLTDRDAETNVVTSIIREFDEAGTPLVLPRSAPHPKLELDHAHWRAGEVAKLCEYRRDKIAHLEEANDRLGNYVACLKRENSLFRRSPVGLDVTYD
ncbi:MAG: hypothetical protein SGARI_000645, partial [Bacillariaceae sp.]